MTEGRTIGTIEELEDEFAAWLMTNEHLLLREHIQSLFTSIRNKNTKRTLELLSDFREAEKRYDSYRYFSENPVIYLANAILTRTQAKKVTEEKSEQEMNLMRLAGVYYKFADTYAQSNGYSTKAKERISELVRSIDERLQAA